MKSLIVEDDFTARRLMQIYLAGFGECAVAINGVEAVNAIEEGMLSNVPYDFVCLDIMMPQMDGLEALKLIRQMEDARGICESDSVKVIVTTAAEHAEDRKTAMRNGCSAYLIKPIRKADLVAEVEKLGFAKKVENR